MSSRFVRGWKASPARLLEFVGTRRLSPREVLESKHNRNTRQDVFVTLGEGEGREDIAAGKARALGTLMSLLEGRPKRAEAYEYARVLELVLNHVARPLAPTESREILLGATYHVPHDDFGCWNPFLRALGLPRLARLWAAQNFAFPWSRRPEKIDWPIWTVLDSATLPLIGAELRPLTRRHLDALPTRALADDPQGADGTRDELWQGLHRLRGWVETVQAPEPASTLGRSRRGNALILLMDGDE